MFRRTSRVPALRNTNEPRRLSLQQLESKQMLAANSVGPAFEIAADLDSNGEIDYVCNAADCPDLDFGPVAPGESKTIGIGIKNVGDTVARKFSEYVDLSGAHVPDNFRLLGGSCLGGWLTAGNSCALGIEFSPNFGDPADTIYGGDPALVALNLSAQNATAATPLTMGMTGSLTAPPEPPTGSENDIYVEDIDFVTSRQGKHNLARILVSINRDSNADGAAGSLDADAAGVLVTVEFRDAAGNLVGTYTGTTDSDGLFVSPDIRKLGSGSYTAEVIDLAHETYTWNHLLDPTGNDQDTDGDGLPDDVLEL